MGVGTYTSTGQFIMTGADGNFTGTLTIPLPLLNVNGVSMYPTVSNVVLLRNGVVYSDYTLSTPSTGSIPGNYAAILSFS